MPDTYRDTTGTQTVTHRLASWWKGRHARKASAAKTVLAIGAGVFLAVTVVQKPLTAPLPNTVNMSDMTWVEVRSAIEHGYTTVIIPTGGIEQNGPHMVLGKHDRIVGFAAQRIASELGHTLVAPVVSFVPEGDYDPPTGHMRFPGTIGIPDRVFGDLIEGVARSLKAAGFKTICLIGDHGGSQKMQEEVAARLNREWAGSAVRVIQVGDYYELAGQLQAQFLEAEGETPSTIGQHAGIADTSELMAVDPAGVDLSRLSNPPFTLESTGIDGQPGKASAERGKALLDLKIDAAVRQIRAAMQARKSAMMDWTVPDTRAGLPDIGNPQESSSL